MYDNQNPYGQYQPSQPYQQYANQTPQAEYYGQVPQNSWTSGWFAVTDPGYVKGLALGAAVTFILTNPKVQRAMVKGAVSLWTTIQGGFEEVKEQIQDIKSEMSMKSDEPKS